jgi:hypothetical protein
LSHLRFVNQAREIMRPFEVYPRLVLMNIDVSYDALLQALVEAVREERDHGTAMMSLVSRLVDEACQQDWFEAHWRTDARLKLAQMACGHMPKGWRSAVPVLEVIAEAARWALKADEIDGEARASLLAITRLADVERSGRTAAKPESQAVAKSARLRKANGAAPVRRRRAAAQPAKPATSAQPTQAAKARPAAKTAATRKAKRAKPMSRSRTTARLAKPAASPQPMQAAKARPAAAKTAAVRKAKRAKPMSRSRTMAQLAKPAASPQAASAAKARPAAAKTAAVRKAKRAKPMSRTKAQLAKPAASPQAASVAKIRPAAAKTAAPPQAMPVAKVLPAAKAAPNGAGQASTGLAVPASAK